MFARSLLYDLAARADLRVPVPVNVLQQQADAIVVATITQLTDPRPALEIVQLQVRQVLQGQVTSTNLFLIRGQEWQPCGGEPHDWTVCDRCYPGLYAALKLISYRCTICGILEDLVVPIPIRSWLCRTLTITAKCRYFLNLPACTTECVRRTAPAKAI